MNMKLLTSNTGAILTVALVGVVAVYYSQKKIQDGLHAISPTNNDNIFASGVDSVGSTITGNENFSLGGWLYEKVNGSSMDLLKQEQQKQAIDIGQTPPINSSNWW